MSHRNPVKPQRQSLIEKEIKLYEVIAKYIRIRCPTQSIFSIDIVYNPSLILISIVKCIERKSEVFCYLFGLFEIDTSGTSRILLIEVVNHITTRYLVSLFSEEKS
jgi:hypothetical protein